MDTVLAQVHFEEHASRPLLALRIILAPFAAIFILLNWLVGLLFLPIATLAYFPRRQRMQLLFRIPSSIIEQVGNWGALLLLLSDCWPPSSAVVRISYLPLASRFEVFFRPMLSIMLLFNAIVFSFPALLALFMQYVHILVFGKRRHGLHLFLESYWRFTLQAQAYAFDGTDERPLLVPPAMRPHNWYRLLE